MLFLKTANIRHEMKRLLLPTFLSLLLVLASYGIIFLGNARPGKILQEALHSMEQNYDTLEIEILEQGQDYKLKFQGNLHNNNILYGNISDYMLDVYKDSLGELFVRDQRDSIWKKAGVLELDSLRDLLVSPLGLLVEWSHLFKKARFVNYSEEGKKVVLLNISQQELQKAMHSNDFFMNPLSLECIVFIDPEKVFIEQIVFSFYDQKLEKNILCRTFFIKIPSKCYIPAQILPQSNIKAGIPAKNFS